MNRKIYLVPRHCFNANSHLLNRVALTEEVGATQKADYHFDCVLLCTLADEMVSYNHDQGCSRCLLVLT